MDRRTHMHTILLLDYDQTLYPSTLPTLKAVDERITLYMCTFLGLSPAEADATRRRFGAQYGTTLKGLEAHHGVDRDHYCDLKVFQNCGSCVGRLSIMPITG